MADSFFHRFTHLSNSIITFKILKTVTNSADQKLKNSSQVQKIEPNKPIDYNEPGFYFSPPAILTREFWSKLLGNSSRNSESTAQDKEQETNYNKSPIDEEPTRESPNYKVRPKFDQQAAFLPQNIDT